MKKPKDIRTFLLELIEIPSPTGSEGQILEYIEDELKISGFEVYRQKVRDKQPNLVARRGNSRFAISTHADQVAVEAGHEFDGEVAKGPGTADTKGQIAALLHAVRETKEPATIIITVDEEKDGAGSLSFQPDGNLSGVLVLEPTDFKVCTHQAGAIEFKARLNTEGYHASCSVLEKNPVFISCRFLNELLEFRKSSEEVKRWGLPLVTPIAIKSGNDEIFASPDTLELTVDIPLAPEENSTTVFAGVLNIAKNHGFEIVYAEVEPGFAFPSSSSILRKVERAYEKTFKKPAEKGIMPSWTDAANFALSGLDTLVFGAGSLRHCHTANEQVKIKDLEALSLFIAKFLEESA